MSASSLNEATIYGGSAPKTHSGVPCTIRDATAIARQSVYWRLKKHPNPNAANFISMAISWLSLARKYEAIERLFSGTEGGSTTSIMASTPPKDVPTNMAEVISSVARTADRSASAT
jgi:hypothetical protein